MITVTDAGPLTTIQDRGRLGQAHLGVPRAGALDAPAADLANRLVGNAEECAVLETTLGGLRFVTDVALTLAVTGAPCPVLVDGRARAFGEPVTVRAGSDVTVGAATAGIRSYLAVAGGVDVAPVLGSRSTDTLAWVGPPALCRGRQLAVGRIGSDRPWSDTPCLTIRAPVLRVHPGPRTDWFADALVALTRSPYAVTHDSNRIGLRLSGPAIDRVRPGELPSEGIVLGAVQVPPDGQPLVFLHDHPVTGGYPVIAVVDPRDLPVCAQARPGDRIDFSLA